MYSLLLLACLALFVMCVGCAAPVIHDEPASEEDAVAASRMRALAALYDTPQCQRAIAWTWDQFPLQQMAREWVLTQQTITHAAPSGANWMYVRVQKSGSDMLMKGLGAIIGAAGDGRPHHRTRRRRRAPSSSPGEVPPRGRALQGANYTTSQGRRLPFCHPGPCRESRQTGSNAPLFAWTVVRDPWPRALSAYAEVTRRCRAADAATFANLSAFSCSAAPSASRRYAAFVERLRRGAVDCRDSFHAWPNALLMDALAPRAADDPRRFDAVARLERLETELPALLRLAGHAAAELDLGRMHGVLAAHHHSHAADPCVANVSPSDREALRWFCALYVADYVCLNYTAPRACEGLAPGFLSDGFASHDCNSNNEDQRRQEKCI